MPAENVKTTQQKRRATDYKRKKLKILLFIGMLLLLLFLVILYASLRLGGVTNLFKGDKDIVTNTLTNIGTTFTDNKEEEKPPQPISFPTNVPDKKEVTVKETQNYVTFDTFSPGEYKITIKKDSFIYFSNNMETRIGLEFSDGRTLKLGGMDKQNMMFTQVGTYTFVDVLDTTGEPIQGVITVVSN